MHPPPTRLAWLGLTPEPERELPAAVAVLHAGSAATERSRIERLLLRGTQRAWLRYLDEVTRMVVAAAEASDPRRRDSARHVAAVVLEHHRMLIGLPGPAYDRTAAQREALQAALDKLGGAP
ncbi:hypothetical protein [Couchioplanes azureus]|uniref:hypothetical protein n=1 Tax=Couchioplanes caeruleus TaxID=56438 RepID=UPI00166FEF5A|nr:hypothetical protein [Couchioplanes caeruleus]GGQ75360.1 hypothetical protein GCM10010166_51700 [Couchioplanes caeruleus subsp. azureus]